jgi:hypothetical protein
MSCGMAGIAGTVMVLYATLVGSVIPNALGNILIAAVISTPAALAIAALMIPFRPDPSPTAQLVIQDPPVSSMDAVAKGTRDGIVFLANIIAMLVGDDRAGQPGQCRARAAPRCRRRAGDVAAPVRLCLPPDHVADRDSRRGDRDRGGADGDQNGPQ